MPKDAKKNIDRYKIRGGDINEFEFHQNQAHVKESNERGKAAADKKAATGKKVATKAKAATGKKATTAKQAAKPAKGATAKKLAAKKANKK